MNTQEGEPSSIDARPTGDFLSSSKSATFGLNEGDYTAMIQIIHGLRNLCQGSRQWYSELSGDLGMLATGLDVVRTLVGTKPLVAIERAILSRNA